MGRRDKQIYSENNTSPSIGVLLRRLRQEKGLSLTYIANQLGYSKSYLSSAENGSRPASKELVKSYERYLELKEGEINELFQAQLRDMSLIHQPISELLPSYWNITYYRNPLFTGREEVLLRLHQMFREDKAIALSQIQSLSGLGGIGKTQTAIEYAYRYQSNYEAVIWVRADSSEVRDEDFASIADLLGLPKGEGRDRRFLVASVQRWLKNHDAWLLIFDNVENLDIVRQVIPPTHNGHILLTTRLQAMGAIAQIVDIENMETEVGALFLLRRANIIAPEAPFSSASEEERVTAQAISTLMDGLPLALDQAGAYIEETKCGLSRYLELYQAQSTDLLKRRGRIVFDHPESVLATLSLSIEKVQRTNPAAVELLRFCAFLYPDAIPEEIIAESTSDLGPTLQHVIGNPIAWDEAVGALLTYSLIRRDANKRTLTIHRLIQSVLKGEMDEKMQRLWAERVVQAVNSIVPTVGEEGWAKFRRYLPQMAGCATLIQQEHMASQEAARLLNKLGAYLVELADYEEGERLLLRALAISEKVLGSEHVDTATILYDIAHFYHLQRKFKRAEQLQQQVLAIREKMFGPEHEETAASLNKLAIFCNAQGKYEQAEGFLRRALAIGEKLPEDPKLADILETWAQHCYAQAQYVDAEQAYQRVLSISEKRLGAEHPKTAESITNLAVLYHAQGLYTQAEPLYRYALEIYEKALGPEHPDTANCLDSLARLYHAQNLYNQAEPLYREALTIRKKVLGLEHPRTAISLDSLASLHHVRHEYEQAESLYLQALDIREKAQDPTHPDVAVSLDQLAALYQDMGQNTQLEFYRRALVIREKALGPKHPSTIKSLNNLVSFYREHGQIEQAASLSARFEVLLADH